jgi:hypothetical protein
MAPTRRDLIKTLAAGTALPATTAAAEPIEPAPRVAPPICFMVMTLAGQNRRMIAGSPHVGITRMEQWLDSGLSWEDTVAYEKFQGEIEHHTQAIFDLFYSAGEGWIGWPE